MSSGSLRLAGQRRYYSFFIRSKFQYLLQSVVGHLCSTWMRTRGPRTRLRIVPVVGIRPGTPLLIHLTGWLTPSADAPPSALASLPEHGRRSVPVVPVRSRFGRIPVIPMWRRVHRQIRGPLVIIPARRRPFFVRRSRERLGALIDQRIVIHVVGVRGFGLAGRHSQEHNKVNRFHRNRQLRTVANFFRILFEH